MQSQTLSPPTNDYKLRNGWVAKSNLWPWPLLYPQLGACCRTNPVGFVSRGQERQDCPVDKVRMAHCVNRWDQNLCAGCNVASAPESAIARQVLHKWFRLGIGMGLRKGFYCAESRYIANEVLLVMKPRHAGRDVLVRCKR